MKVIFLIGSFCFLVFCANKNDIKEAQSTYIRVINSTDVSFTNVVLFSMKFENLGPKDTTAYQILDYDPLKDDSLIYCTNGESDYAHYLEIPSDDVRNFSYRIDSIQDGIMYVSSEEEY